MPYADAAVLLIYAPIVLTFVVPTLAALMCGARFLYR